MAFSRPGHFAPTFLDSYIELLLLNLYSVPVALSYIDQIVVICDPMSWAV